MALYVVGFVAINFAERLNWFLGYQPAFYNENTVHTSKGRLPTKFLSNALAAWHSGGF
jgi:hypothetical protein